MSKHRKKTCQSPENLTTPGVTAEYQVKPINLLPEAKNHRSLNPIQRRVFYFLLTLR